MVAHYGDSGSELRGLREGCGVADRRWRKAFWVRGEDRVRFLNAYLTCDVADLTVGCGVVGFFTSAQGRILADAVVTCSDGGLRVEVPASRVEPLIEHLTRFVLADRVELTVEQDRATLLLAGPGIDSLLEASGVELPTAAWSWLEATVDGCALEIRREGWTDSFSSYSILAPAGDGPAVLDALLERGAIPVGFDALETLRIEAGVPRYGAEFDDRRFPQEVGFEDAVSYTKGCYLGQEVVARIHYRGHINHHLRALVGKSTSVPPPGAAIELDGEPVGEVGSAVFSSRLEAVIGLAVLHRKAIEQGTQVVVAGTGAMRVETPGFAIEAEESGA